MSILSSIGRIATEYSAARTRARTERTLRSLPLELRKDIGLVEAVDGRTNHHHGLVGLLVAIR